ncbi:unnamed protein product [Amoebophrya sp. A120]|nr:unnamed protein product [Amoebophrya sp. A120]|eukprot:GSA120T00025565001.1
MVARTTAVLRSNAAGIVTGAGTATGSTSSSANAVMLATRKISPASPSRTSQQQLHRAVHRPEALLNPYFLQKEKLQLNPRQKVLWTHNPATGAGGSIPAEVNGAGGGGATSTASSTSSSSSSSSTPSVSNLDLALLTNRGLRKQTMENIVNLLGSDLGRLLLSIPKNIGPERAFVAYKRFLVNKINSEASVDSPGGALSALQQSKLKAVESMTFQTFEEEYRKIMPMVKWERQKRVDRNHRKRLKPHLLRRGNQHLKINETAFVTPEFAEVNDFYEKGVNHLGGGGTSSSASTTGGSSYSKCGVCRSSLLFDYYLAESYAQRYNAADAILEEQQQDNITAQSTFISSSVTGKTTSASSSSFQKNIAAAFRDEYLDSVRPVLGNELSDWKTPAMMKKSILTKILNSFTRNKIEKSVVEKIVDNAAMKSMISGRLTADLPPEVLEPVFSFNGNQSWSFDPRERVRIQLENVEGKLDELLADDLCHHDAQEMTSSRTATSTKNDNDPHHLHRGVEELAPVTTPNSTTFPSLSPETRGELLGSYKFGKPQVKSERVLNTLRYPTLQSVANRLPEDKAYRSHVWSVINILERQKGWTFADKIRAVQTLKEVYYNLKKSSYWRRRIDKKLPLMCPSKRERKKYGHGHKSKYVQQVNGGSMDKSYKRRVLFRRYRSLCRLPCKRIDLD